MRKLNPNDFAEDQKLSHCGIASLMYCLRVYGVVATQRQIRKAAGLSAVYVWFKGVEPEYIAKAAEHFGFVVKEHNWTSKTKFNSDMKKRAKQGKPSIVLTCDYEHWTSVLGYANGKFIVRDPIDPTAKIFKFQTQIREARNEDDGKIEYCALFVDRKN
jgi:ABC-type bacteriocin/lantibiotic exporter with double-glycine peptidase domain